MLCTWKSGMRADARIRTRTTLVTQSQLPQCSLVTGSNWSTAGKCRTQLRCIRPQSQRRYGRLLVWAAQQVNQVKKPVPLKTATSWGRDSGADSDTRWNLFDGKQFNRPWNVPWGAGLVAGGMVLWALTFLSVGFYIVPKAYQLSGFDFRHATASDKAQFTLVCQMVQTVTGVGLIRILTNRASKPATLQLPGDVNPDADLVDSEDSPVSSVDDPEYNKLFNYSLSAPFEKPKGWLTWGLLGVAGAPLVVGATAFLLTSLHYDQMTATGRGTVDGVAQIITPDLASYASLLMVTGVLAPVMEETVFRGFLLTSLTKYMPTWTAVVISALAFAGAHMSSKDFPVLAGLGIFLGFLYVRSRNLLTPILVHGAWNSGVLSLLFYLAASGVDIQQMLHDLKSMS